MHLVFDQRSAVEAPASPSATRVTRPRWFDTRFVVGVVLVLVSVVVGARIIAGADSTSPVWLASRNLPAGTTLTADDLHKGRAHLEGVAGRYLGARGAAPIGYVLTRSVGVDELIPSAAVTAAANAVPSRLVTIPVAAFHLPPHLVVGDRVDVYVTPDGTAGAPGRARLVFANALVAAVDRGSADLGASDSDIGVVVTVPPSAAAALVTAVHGGAVDLTGRSGAAAARP